MALDPTSSIHVLAGVVMGLLAPAMLYLDPQADANRALSAFLAAQGGALFTQGMALWSETVAGAGFWYGLYPYFSVAIPFTVAYFVSVYPRRRSWMPEGLPAWAPFLVGTVILEIVLLGRPELFWELGALTPERVQTVLFPPFRGLGMMFWIGEIALLVGALILTRDVVRGEPGTKRMATALVGMGLFAPASCQCAGGEFLNRTFYNGWTILGTPPAQDPFTSGVSVALLHELLILAVVGLFLAEYAYLVYHAVTTDDEELRRVLRPFVALVTVSLAVLVAIFTPLVPESLRGRLWFSLYPFWWLVGTGLVVYAVARHSLFDLDRQVKSGIKRSTMAGTFVAVFFVASEAAQVVFAGVAGNELIGVLAAGGLVFFLAPLQRFAEDVADRVMPRTKAIPEMSPAERRDLFREQAELVWMDGQLSEKDRKVLRNLRERLDLDASTAEAIESDVLEA